MGKPRDVVILGSTGSIGTQAAQLISRNPNRFRIVALGAGGSHLRLLAEQAVAFDVPAIGVAAGRADDLAQAIERAAADAGRPGYRPQLHVGPEANVDLARLPADVVLNGITGSIGLLPTLAALEAGRTVALANKESLIVGGDLVTDAAQPGQLVPVDSEHSAVAQCLRAGSAGEVTRLVLTASGGPFRGWDRTALADVTPEQALAHPTWQMGPVVTTNSATLVNKGLEIIEAHLLFGLPYDRIDVVIHPQSVVHSMVEFVDGSTLAQASPPDMQLPIALALGWPARVPGAARSCDWTRATSWEFDPVDEDAFPAIRLARQVGAAGSTVPAVFNAANEECVYAFLSGQVRFPAIVDTVRRVVEDWTAAPQNKTGPLDVETVLAAERWARYRTAAVLRGMLPR